MQSQGCAPSSSQVSPCHRLESPASITLSISTYTTVDTSASVTLASIALSCPTTITLSITASSALWYPPQPEPFLCPPALP